MNNSNPMIVADVLNPNVFEEALDAIHSNQLGQAHHLLLQALQTEPQNIQVWLLLGWTAPTSASAIYYFHHLLEQYPDTPLAQDLLQQIKHKSGSEVSTTELSINDTKKLISKAIDHLEKPELESQITDEKEKLMDNQTESIKPRILGIPKGLWIPLAYLAALTLAEAITTLAIPQIGLIMHGLILIVLILHATLFAQHGLQKFLMTLTLAPLIRLMSLSTPLLSFPLIYWYALIGVPLLLAAYLVLRMTGFKATRIGLNMRALPWQFVVGLTGFVFGYLEYKILKPTPLVEALTWQQILLPALSLLIFTGFLEEFIFRGLIQRGAAGTIGHYSLLYVAVLFAVLHLGYRSVWDLVFVFAVALFFGLVVIRTGSLLGVTLSHGLTNIMLYLIIPFLLNASTNPVTATPQLVVDRTTQAIMWTIPDINAKLFTLDNGDIGMSWVSSQSGIIETHTNIRPNWLFIDDQEIKTNDKWHPRVSDYKACMVEEYSLFTINAIYSEHYSIRSYMATIE